MAAIMPYPKQLQIDIERVGQGESGPAITVTMCFEYLGLTRDGYPILKDKLTHLTHCLVPYEGERKG